MSFIPPIIDAQLNISVHSEEGLVVPIIGETDGTQDDLSGRDMVITIHGVLRKQLAPHAIDPLGRTVLLTRAEVNKIPIGGANFAVVDNTGPVPQVRWEGRITRRA